MVDSQLNTIYIDTNHPIFHKHIQKGSPKGCSRLIPERFGSKQGVLRIMLKSGCDIVA